MFCFGFVGRERAKRRKGNRYNDERGWREGLRWERCGREKRRQKSMEEEVAGRGKAGGGGGGSITVSLLCCSFKV